MKKLLVVILLVFSCIPLSSLFHAGLPLTHDGPDHVARIANFYQALREGVLVPRWAANLNWGYGHPILMFLYPLPSYAASVVHAVGFSLVDSVKIIFGVSFVASVLTMYLWMSTAWGTTAGIVGALLYGFAPYRFVDLYVRGAIGEHVAFIFPPLVLYFLLKLARSRKTSWYFSGSAIATGALILAHNAISLMFMPIIALYILYLYFFETEKSRKFLFVSVFSVASGFLLSAFFWVPALLEGKYTLRDIVTRGTIGNSFSSWGNFFYMPWSYGGSTQLSKELGFVQWTGIIGSFLVFVRSRKKSLRWMLGVGFFILLCSLWFMTAPSDFIWERVSLLQKFQFPWRLLSVSVFVAAFLGGIVISVIKRHQKLIAAAVLIFLILTTFFMWKPSGYSYKNESYYTDIYNSTTDTGESSPIWSVRFMERRPAAWMEIIEGKGNIATVSRSTTKHIYQITASSPVRVLENTLYFPGWIIRVDGAVVPVEFQDPQYRGLMTFRIDPGIHDVVISFEDTKVRKLASILSIAGIVAVIGFFGLLKKI